MKRLLIHLFVTAGAFGTMVTGTPLHSAADNYNLTVIQDENATPLAAGPVENNFFFLTVIMVIAVIALFIILLYIFECMKCRQRYLTLFHLRTGHMPGKMSWNVCALRDMVREEEAMAADQLLQ
jgi:hypothetical protein